MHRHVLVSFFESIVFANVVQIIPSDDDRSSHFQFHHCTGEDSTSDADVTGEWTFLVDVSSFDRLESGEAVRHIFSSLRFDELRAVF